MAITSDTNINEKEIEKITKYQYLKLEVQKLWKIKGKSGASSDRWTWCNIKRDRKPPSKYPRETQILHPVA